MARCTACGAADQSNRFCTSCGEPMAVADPSVGVILPPPVVNEEDLADTVVPAEPSGDLLKSPQSPPAVAFGQQAPFGAPPERPTYPPVFVPPASAPSQRRGWLIAGVVVVVAALATTTILILQRSGVSTSDQV